MSETTKEIISADLEILRSFVVSVAEGELHRDEHIQAVIDRVAETRNAKALPVLSHAWSALRDHRYWAQSLAAKQPFLWTHVARAARLSDRVAGAIRCCTGQDPRMRFGDPTTIESERRPAILVRFDMEKVDGGIRPGLACWRIFWQAVDPEEIAGASLWEGPSRDSLQGQEAIHCIAVSHDQKRILEKLEPLLQAQLANFASGRIFLRDDECRSEPLLNAGIVSKDAIIVGATEDPGGPSGRAQSALDQVRAERRAAALDLEPPLAPEPESGPQSFVDLCLIPAFREMPESRHWTEMPDHKRVNDPLNAGDYPKAAAAAKELAKQYPDLDAVYVLWAEALIGMRDLAGARKIAQQGLERSRSKHDLCNVLGKISWNAGALDETVYWWTQGLQCQETLGESNNFGNDPNTYLYLAEIAHVLGLHDCASALILLRGDCIRSGQIRLGQSTSASIHLLVTSAPSLRDELAIIIEELVGLYVEPLVPRGHRADEVSELTRKLVIGLEQHLDTEEALQIIARLQAMGDLRAIPALRYIEQKSYSARISPAAGAAIGRIQRGSRT